MLLGVDVGGTFTDAVVYDGEALHTAKAPTTPEDQSRGVIAAVEAALERAGAGAGSVDAFAHGMTVGTNALLEERGARTALVATAGFTDLLDVARQDRPSLYHLCEPKPAPLVGDELRFGVAERTTAEGVIEPLSAEETERLAGGLEAAGPESVAVCLLFSYLDPGHERALAEVLRERLEGTHVSVSHEVLPQFREYERCSTTVIDAYLSPLLSRYLERLAEAARERGLPEPAVMKSSGGIAPLEEARRAGAETVLSGPAGGGGGDATATRSGSTWAAPRATSASSRRAACSAPTRAGSAAA
jgi:N-methylhydantoinase A/oxoprolinase/acetone carboxylase beta subunit